MDQVTSGRLIISNAAMRYPQATIANPCRATSVSNFSEAPLGFFSPRSHWLMSPGETFN